MRFLILVQGLLCALAFLTACAPQPLTEPAWAEPRPLGRDIAASTSPRERVGAESAFVFEPPTGMLSLRDALAAALVNSPDLAAAAYEVRALEAEALQAGVLPNPEVEFEFEDFAGSGELNGTDAAEFTLALSQLIELGGQRVKRQRVAQYGARLAGWDYEVRRIDVLSKTAADFIGVLSAERRLEMAAESLIMAERVAEIVGERVRAGKISPVEQAKARVEQAHAQLEREQAARSVEAARMRLASNWGSIEAQFNNLAGNLDDIETPPAFESLLARVEQNPDLERWAAEAAQRQAELELALAQRIPDVTVTGGIRYFNEIDETAFLAAVSLPLPVFDQNDGGIQSARLRALQAQPLEDAARIRIRVALAESYAALETAYVTVESMRIEIVPGASASFEAAEEAFRQGKIGAIDLLDAERTLFDARRELSKALTMYHLAVIGCERLIGAPLHDDAENSGDEG